jgi:hypothetical protein
MAKKKELIDVIGKLRACIKPMIGHPENPFDETYLQELVDLADEHLDTGTVYTDEEFDNFDSLSLEEMCEFLKFELEKDTQPF